MKAKTAELRHPWGLVQRILSEDSGEGAEGGLSLTAGFGSVWSLPLPLDLNLTKEQKPGLRAVSKGSHLQLR